MCGIVGIAGAGDEDIVRRMAATIAHRGPDGDGFFVDADVSLGARRLSIIDLPGSNQPIFNEDGSVVTVFNGEIYNYRELRTLLLGKGHRLKTQGDTEVLVHLYEEYGEAAVHLLRGMFAYALWDARRHRLVLVRDRLGIKPLYYAERQGVLAFASEIKALLAVPGMPRDLDRHALDLYLTLQYVPGPSTLLAGVRKLLPGHMLIWENGHSRVQRYWDVVLAESDPRAREADAVEEFKALLEDSVRAHRISDVPVGVLLSGGIDSASVTALLAATGDAPQTFTVGFQNGGEFNELAEARLVADHVGSHHHEVVVASAVADILPRLAWFQDEPVADPAAVPTYFVCRFASGTVKVVLTGEGGDEVLGGYPRYRWLHASEELRRRGAGRAAVGLARGLLPVLGRNRLAGRVRRLVDAAPLADRHLAWIGNLGEPLKRALLQAPLAGNGSSASTLVADLLDSSGVDDTVAGLMYVDFKTWLPDNVLTKIDRMSMAVSIEARVPLLDHRVVEFAAALPREAKMRGFTNKRLLRQALAGRLPPQALQRRKRAFRVPLAAWFAGGLRDFLGDTLGSSAARQRGLFRATEVARLVDDQAAGRADHSQVLWNLLSLELWFRAFVDADSAGHA